MDVKEILKQIESRLQCGWPNPMVKQTTEETSAILAYIRELEARVERAERERDEAIKALSEEAKDRALDIAIDATNAVLRLETENDTLKARAEQAEAALNYFLLRDPDKPTSWEYSRDKAEELARAAMGWESAP